MELMLNIFITVCIFIIGSLFGSFFSLATYRLPRRQDIVATRSYCPNCKHNLNFFDLIPVLSYIFCLGKCRYCKDKISLRYFMLELSNGIIFVIMYLIFGYTFNFLIVALIYVLLFVFIGTLIMDKKMTDAEREQVNKEITEKKKNKLSNKKGVFISELVVAMILFTILLASSYVISRNYTSKGVVTTAKSNAVALAVKNIEVALATDYDNLASFNVEEELDGRVYKVSVSVLKYSDQDFSKKDLVKTIEVNVNYLVDGKVNEFNLKTLKGRVI